MAQERSEALVIRGVNFSETSRIVNFLCPIRGRLVCMAKGARRPKSQLAGLLDTFNRLELVYYWKDGRSVQQLGDAALLDGFRGLKADLAKSTFGALPLELAHKVSNENEPSEELYSELLHGLEQLEDWSGDVRTHVCWQVFRLLSAAGFEPSLEACVRCGKPAGPRAGFAYEGGVTCGACPSDRKAELSTLESLRLFAGSREKCPRASVSHEAYHILRHFAMRQLETDFRSARVIEQMFP
ncbi:MAG TPA: DNA repair protein RecO [Gammaproteobacteria bacterium]|nr:DNA repair protein RecO [Gammaproteobacteria bacterium]